ncbi:MAG: ATP-binding protein [Chthoniobacterales bacterium]
MKTVDHNSSAPRAEELFQQHRQEIFRNTDQLFARLMLVQWIAAIVAAVIITPQTWGGTGPQSQLHVWTAIMMGAAISLFPIWMTRARPGSVATRQVIAVAQMLMSALLISLTGGRIETHFHVFGSLVILSFYRDWRVLVPATIVVALDHFLRGIYWPYTVYGVMAASPWRSIEHAGWVVFEDIFLVISCLRSIREMRSIANRTAALEANEKNFRQIFEEAPTGMAVIGLDERFLQANTTICSMLGYSEEELGTRTESYFTHVEDVARSREMAEQMRKGMDRSAMETRYLRKNGEIVWARRTACLVRDEEGKPRHFLIMVDDISEQKRAEEALHQAKADADRANHAKSEFLSRISHELRTPLNAILGFSQLIERQSVTEKERGRVSHIVKAGRHLLKLINEVLDISRIDAGNFQVSLEPVCLADAVAESVDLIRPMAAERSIEIASDAVPRDGCHVTADQQRLKQVLLNLLGNGVKYTPVGGKLTLASVRMGDGRVRLEIEDNGEGIPPDKVARLFTPFDRLGAEHSEVEGTGLGLALSQRLMQAMNGEIGVTSAIDQGSTFWVELPFAESPLKAVEQQRVAVAPEEAPRARRTVLYIEDNLSNLTLMQQVLAGFPDIELLSAMQGRVGIDLARKHSPDVILLDLHLPDLPGWEVLNRLRAHEATSEIPVMVISADATARQIQRLLAAGAQRYLTKPIDLAEFARAMEEIQPRELECAAA